MSLFTDALVNLWRLIRNARARLLGRPPEYVWIEVSGPLAEFETPVGFLRRRLSQGPSPPTLERLRLWLDRIAADGHPRGVVLRIKKLDAGWAAIEELRREILAFRSRGGRVVAYFADPADIRSYYLACAADEILITSGSTQGLALVNSLLVGKGDTILVEQETYGSAISRLVKIGVNAIGIPLDDAGAQGLVQTCVPWPPARRRSWPITSRASARCRSSSRRSWRRCRLGGLAS